MKRIEAIEESLKHWRVNREKVTDGVGLSGNDIDANSCALCSAFPGCRKCPLMKHDVLCGSIGSSWLKVRDIVRSHEGDLLAAVDGMIDTLMKVYHLEQIDVAIEAWERIKKVLGSRYQIEEIKKEVCEEAGVEWEEDCYFCNYYACGNCPLAKSTEQYFPRLFKQGEGYGLCCQDYWIVTGTYSNYFGQDEKRAACDRIIAALREEAKKYT